jgi:hypothetical protein
MLMVIVIKDPMRVAVVGLSLCITLAWCEVDSDVEDSGSEMEVPLWMWSYHPIKIGLLAIKQHYA